MEIKYYINDNLIEESEDDCGSGVGCDSGSGYNDGSGCGENYYQRHTGSGSDSGCGEGYGSGTIDGTSEKWVMCWRQD